MQFAFELCEIQNFVVNSNRYLKYKQNDKIPTEAMIAMTRTTQPVKMSVENNNQVDGLLGHN